MHRHAIRWKAPVLPIAAMLILASFGLDAYAQDWGGMLKNVLNNKAPNPQDIVSAIRSISQVTHGRVNDNVQPPQDAEGRVILYRTSWCGYCKQAAGYMQQKGIPFLERNIEASVANKAEYVQYGGKGGVPLLVFGQTTMQGFAPNKFDQMYAEFQRTPTARMTSGTAFPGTHIVSTSTTPQSVIQTGDSLVGKIGSVAVYAQADKSAPLLTRLNKAEEAVYMGEEEGGLYRVTTAAGEGWVDKLLVRKP